MMHKNWIFRNDLFVSHPLGLLAHRVICCEWKKTAERSLTNWAVAFCHNICLPCCKICDRCDVSSPVHCTTTLSKEKKSLILDITVSCIWLIQIFSLSFQLGRGLGGAMWICQPDSCEAGYVWLVKLDLIISVYVNKCGWLAVIVNIWETETMKVSHITSF